MVIFHSYVSLPEGIWEVCWLIPIVLDVFWGLIPVFFDALFFFPGGFRRRCIKATALCLLEEQIPIVGSWSKLAIEKLLDIMMYDYVPSGND